MVRLFVGIIFLYVYISIRYAEIYTIKSSIKVFLSFKQISFIFLESLLLN